MKLYYVVKPVEVEGSDEYRCRYYPVYITYSLERAYRYFDRYTDESIQLLVCSQEITEDTKNLYYIEEFESYDGNEIESDTFYGLWDYISEIDEDEFNNNYISYNSNESKGPKIIELEDLRKWNSEQE